MACQFQAPPLSFDQGPLSPSPLKLFHFISLACLPIKLTNSKNNTNRYSVSTRSFLLAIKVILFAIIFHSYSYKQFMYPYVILILYCLHLYIELELVLAICAAPARALFGFELEPQFSEPYLTTSLQDFWGRRWNLMVTSILRPTVYNPIRDLSIRLIGPVWASLPAVFVTFVVSGLIHELLYFYLTRVSPTWEVTWFFVLHGICVAIEVAVKRVVKDRWRLHPVVSGALTIVFVAVTGLWLFFPQLTRNGVDTKVIKELSIVVDFVKHNLSTLSMFN
ncbi:LOW QUALITY PROTEIN: probable long-chain-alcohol O-fatty-acyltransferase 5 [Jatropha curcas]|uniref:LOW QUALITY PROTEIN: probable long-chain-alcohol O-fatty-acyltransferase 5 n=1 Tax=Jatropha curcas TaxID=180498 RepID=UPI0018948BDC|nr:LOW QUALITY PROTEIN: probable long-chain-alcohol O-fatty-acyltransferase 5 [Jatropha curcas]